MSLKIKFKTRLMAKSRRALAFKCSQHSPTPVCGQYNKSKSQQGFTLIELLVVVSILAALAGLASVAMDGYQQESEETITRVEIQRIANAIRRFKVDTGYWPKTETAVYAYKSEDKANFSFLFNNPTGVPAWDIEYAIGWHGPYVDLPAIKPIVVDSGNAGCPISNSNDYDALQLLPRLNGLVDRFKQLREKVTGKNYCVLTREKKDPSKFKVAEYSSSPYLYETAFTHTDNILCKKDTVTPTNTVTCIALRSFGSDGIDDDGTDASDDIVFILQVN